MSRWDDDSEEAMIPGDAPHGGLGLRAAAGKSDNRQCRHCNSAREIESRIEAAIPTCVKAARWSSPICLPFPASGADHPCALPEQGANSPIFG